MLIHNFGHNGTLFTIYFGDAQDKIFKEDLVGKVKLAKEKVGERLGGSEKICDMPEFANLKKNIKFENLVFLNQVHGTQGLVINSAQQAKEMGGGVESEGVESFAIDGDFLVTNVAGVAIGVLTADCLPIVFVDSVKKVVAVAHAGWRGSVGEIAVKTIESMQKNFGTQVQDLQVFFGPCIDGIFYKVGDDFRENLKEFDFADRVLLQKPDGLYFYLTMLNAFLLLRLGVKRENISLDYNLCTFSDKNFFSYRRGDKDGRQMTVVCLG